ncbi:S8/S53 family peptidase [Actinoplanes sp. NPDC051411]|uniref:S8 family peptidase n=1 Tax=Actinoplanes sp. NPDC051411 TaxID=3155522 RepID=UPI003439CA8D
MDNRYSADTITIAGDSPDDIERLNDIIDSAIHKRPLGRPVRTFGRRTVVPVRGHDPVEVSTVLRAAGAPGDPRPQLVFFSGTNQIRETPGGFADHHLFLIGNDVGHGLLYSPLPPDYEPPAKPDWKRPAGHLRRPVIALFDSGVREHEWLPDADPDDPFVLHPDDPALSRQWSSPVPEAPAGEPKAGHATFNAGLIRMNAPSAQVLSIRVMDGEGMVDESNVVDALLWLEDYRRTRPVDVVLMPFGRSPDDEMDDDRTLDELRAPIERLAGQGVAFVASAGNDHQSRGIHPALFDDVTAVGAGFGEYHAKFSNHGDWVDRYREGVNALSILPGDGWGRWSGTSFSAAVLAADLAHPHVA